MKPADCLPLPLLVLLSFGADRGWTANHDTNDPEAFQAPLITFNSPWTSPFRVDPDWPHHLVNRDGDHLLILNKTAWAFFGCQDPGGYLDRARSQGVNVIRVALEGRPYWTDLGIELWPWGGTRAQPAWNTFNETYWQRVEDRVRLAGEKGIGLDVVLYMELHPEANDIPTQRFYWEHALRRLGRYGNILTWEVANEYTRNETFQDAAGRFFKEHDPQHRPVCTSDGTTDDAVWPQKPWMDLAINHTCTSSTPRHDLRDWYQAVARNTRAHGKPAWCNETGRERRHQNDDGVHRRKQGWVWYAAGCHWTWHSWDGCEGINDRGYRAPGEEFLRPMVETFRALPFWRMNPNQTAVVVNDPALVQATLATSERDCLLFYCCTRETGKTVSGAGLILRLPDGAYRLTLLKPADGAVLEHRDWVSKGPGQEGKLALPSFTDDLAVRIKRAQWLAGAQVAEVTNQILLAMCGVVLLATTSGSTAVSPADPLRLHPENPRYFQFRGRPIILVTSGEHYGAVLNLDFNYTAYLDELARHRFNLTRIFSGTYREVAGSFRITGNTLAPAAGRFLCPWARSSIPGASDGGNTFDNLYYEVCNEPYERGGLTENWNDGIIATIVETEAALANQHLVARGFPPSNSAVANLNPHVSILNFHAAKPAAVRLNGHHNRVVAFDETGGADRSNRKYRTEGWDWLLAGGAVYNHLDFSFTTDRPDGTAVPLPPSTPGGGGPELRRQLRILKDFIEGFDFIRMAPHDEIIIANRISAPPGASPSAPKPTARALAEIGQAYAIYVNGGTQAELELDLPGNSYQAQWINTQSCQIHKTEPFSHGGGTRTLTSPVYSEDIALRIVREGRLVTATVPATPAVPTASHASELGVSPSGRHLTVQGNPFFWLGDTVWLLAQVPSRDEIELYLKTRAEQGFTVIQLTAVMGEERVWGTARRTSRGDAPFIENDVLKPAVTPGNDPSDPGQYDYWDHLDFVLERIHAHGFRAALVTYFVGWQGEGYKFLKPANAQAYGRFLGARFRGKPEIIWVLGGDNTPKTDDQKAIWPLVAKGLAEGLTGREDDTQVLMTYHINGGASSAQLWHQSPWLDFNMAQTWDAYQNIYPAILSDYQRTPVKPCGLGEGAYEDGPQYPTKPINALVIRQQACWSWFAGGYHTYGNGNVWHFDTCKPELTQTWKEALRSPGAATLRHCKNFLTKIGWWKFVPDASLFVEGEGSGRTRNVAMRSVDGDAIAVYWASSATVKLRLDKVTVGGTLTAQWTHPATGEERSAGTFDRQARSFTPPAGWGDALLHVAAQKRTPK